MQDRRKESLIRGSKLGLSGLKTNEFTQQLIFNDLLSVGLSATMDVPAITSVLRMITGQLGHCSIQSSFMEACLTVPEATEGKREVGY